MIKKIKKMTQFPGDDRGTESKPICQFVTLFATDLENRQGDSQPSPPRFPISLQTSRAKHAERQHGSLEIRHLCCSGFGGVHLVITAEF